jgi:hypothetical protein
MPSTVADLLQTIEALSLPEQQELLIALLDRLVIAHGPEDADWIESIRNKIDAVYASTEPSVDGSTFIQQQRAIYQGRLQDLQRDALTGWEAAQRGELIDGPTAMAEIRAQLQAKHSH